MAPGPSDAVDVTDSSRPLTYREAGVDISAGEKTVELIKPHVRSTFRPEVIGDIGGFGGLFAIDWQRYDNPLLVS
jgi:phosphoribosylformylglycinamidine cyclo-ligase